jgi:hypothetical protein
MLVRGLLVLSERRKKKELLWGKNHLREFLALPKQWERSLPAKLL